MKNISLPFILTLIVCVTLSFFIGRWSVSTNNITDAVKPTKELAEKANEEKKEGTIAINEPKVEQPEEEKKDTLTDENPIEDNSASDDNNTQSTPVQPIATRTITPQPSSKIELERVKMGISDEKIAKILSSVAQNLENKKLVYSSKLFQDCSGIFHQMKDSLQSRLPALAESLGKYQYPSSKNVRNTRQIADWYYKNNNLLIVQDAMTARNSIRPGAVMFYGKSNKTYKNITIDMLTDRDNNYTSNGAIMHIAVVTSVTTDAEGNVVDYTIMHGRNPNNHASRTGSKAVQSTRTKGLPPFGNWSQQLVAIANIATPNS
jgi:hypothetical protein